MNWNFIWTFVFFFILNNGSKDFKDQEQANKPTGIFSQEFLDANVSEIILYPIRHS